MSRLYLLKLWIATIAIVAPILLCLWSIIVRHNQFTLDDLKMLPLFVAFGLIFSLPTFFLCWLVFEILNAKYTSPILTKLILGVVSILGAAATLLKIGGTMVSSLIILYSVSVAVSSLLFKIDKKETSNEAI